MKFCSRCVMPSSTPNIMFDEDGVCSHCLEYNHYPLKGETVLENILESQKERSGRYDCIVAASGGRDSTYTMLKLTQDYGMHVLAVNYENPFTDPVASENIRQATDMLGVDLTQFSFPRDLHRKTFRINALAWFKRPSPAMIPMVCIACKMMFQRIIQIAHSHNVGCIVSGGNPLEYSGFKKELLGVSRNERPEMMFMRSLGGLLNEVRKNPRYLHPTCLSTMAKGYLFGDPYCPGSRLLGSDLDRIDLFHYIPWDEKEAYNRIRSDAGWDYPRRFNSPWRFDCQVGHLKDYMYMHTLGMTERNDFYSQMVRQHLISRDEALQRLGRENVLHLDEVEQLLDSVGINTRHHMTKFEEEHPIPAG